MPYSMPCYAEKIKIFAHTRPIEKLGGFVRRIGESYAETKDAPPLLMLEYIVKDIKQAILDDELPDLSFRVSVERFDPVPIFRIAVLEIDPGIEGISFAELAAWVQKKLMQILWKRNADVVSFKGIYSYTHFAYQIVFQRPTKMPSLHAIVPSLVKLAGIGGKVKKVDLFKLFKREFQDMLGELSVEELSRNSLLLQSITRINRLLTHELTRKGA